MTTLATDNGETSFAQLVKEAWLDAWCFVFGHKHLKEDGTYTTICLRCGEHVSQHS